MPLLVTCPIEEADIKTNLVADNLERSYIEYDAGAFGKIKYHKFPGIDDTSTPLTDFLKGRNNDYVLTEEEHRNFDAVEGVTKEEIEMAKKVLSKTLSKKEEDFVRWRVYGGIPRNTGINSNGVMNDHLLPGEVFPRTELESRLEYLNNLKKSLGEALKFGAIKVGEAVQIISNA